MGFWKKTYRVYQDVSSLGGTYRLRTNLEERSALIEIYERLRQKIEDCRADVIALTVRVQKEITNSERRLLKIQRMLNPVRSEASVTAGAQLPLKETASMMRASYTEGVLDRWSSTHLATAAGASAATASTAGSWGAVQAIGHASTHTGMAGLHGAAASNAGWAWFGGGSLATQGGGMALGHIVLPGIGTAVLVGVSATLAHKEANKVATACKNLLAANEENALVLEKGEASAYALSNLETRLLLEGGRLVDALREAKHHLFPLGFLSRLWRYFKFRFTGTYYEAGEIVHLETLKNAAARFVAAFRHG